MRLGSADIEIERLSADRARVTVRMSSAVGIAIEATAGDLHALAVYALQGARLISEPVANGKGG
jgi:hypothetical protein